MKKFILSLVLINIISLKVLAQREGCSTKERSAKVNFHKNSSDSTKSRGLADNYYLWDNGKVITVKFLSGSKQLQNKIKPIPKQWEKYANIKFKFVETGDAEIRIFLGGSGSGHWSTIGTTCKEVTNQYEQTMNFDTANIGDNAAFMKAVVLHEFGHAIGLLHEHSSPLSGIQWDKEKAYEEYAKCCDWTKEDVDFQVFETYKVSYTNGTGYDNKSIMHYPIMKGETINDYVVDWNYSLSKGDTLLIKALYPKKGVRKNEVTRISILNFSGIRMEGNEAKQGISLFPAFDLKTGSKGGKVKMIIKFYDSEFYGYKDEDGTYEENGVVATMRTVLLPANKVIRYNQLNKKDFEFFLPFDQIPMDALSQNLIVTLKIVYETSEGEIKDLYRSQGMQFNLGK